MPAREKKSHRSLKSEIGTTFILQSPPNFCGLLASHREGCRFGREQGAHSGKEAEVKLIKVPNCVTCELSLAQSGFGQCESRTLLVSLAPEGAASNVIGGAIRPCFQLIHR